MASKQIVFTILNRTLKTLTNKLLVTETNRSNVLTYEGNPLITVVKKTTTFYQ